jgi:hypothetical protein
MAFWPCPTIDHTPRSHARKPCIIGRHSENRGFPSHDKHGRGTPGAGIITAGREHPLILPCDWRFLPKLGPAALGRGAFFLVAASEREVITVSYNQHKFTTVALLVLLCVAAVQEGKQQFLFEKKNQKTFGY